ncbi:hypothetical protein ACFYTU_54635 [Nonomuraea angiospora]|uniref:hypothetical protein n=1 Tax=Nonomuraea angiospora TaxID=46172 RepID=UPI00369F5363
MQARCRCSTPCRRSPGAFSKVVIIGPGVSGQNAANIALGMGADVTLLDNDLDKLRLSFWRYDNRVRGPASSRRPAPDHNPTTRATNER